MVSFSNFHRLDPAVRDVAVHLLDLADRQQSEMMSFVTVWMAFNGWMAAVTGLERRARSALWRSQLALLVAVLSAVAVRRIHW